MKTEGRLVSEIRTNAGNLVVRHVNSVGFRGGHYSVVALERAHGRTVTLDLSLLDLIGLAHRLDQEIKHAAQGGV